MNITKLVHTYTKGGMVYSDGLTLLTVCELNYLLHYADYYVDWDWDCVTARGAGGRYGMVRARNGSRLEVLLVKLHLWS